MKSKRDITNRIKELEQSYKTCFHAPTCAKITRSIAELKWVLSTSEVVENE